METCFGNVLERSGKLFVEKLLVVLNVCLLPFFCKNEHLASAPLRKHFTNIVFAQRVVRRGGLMLRRAQGVRKGVRKGVRIFVNVFVKVCL